MNEYKENKLMNIRMIAGIYVKKKERWRRSIQERDCIFRGSIIVHTNTHT